MALNRFLQQINSLFFSDIDTVFLVIFNFLGLEEVFTMRASFMGLRFLMEPKMRGQGGLQNKGGQANVAVMDTPDPFIRKPDFEWR